jgi:hypothetical protein
MTMTNNSPGLATLQSELQQPERKESDMARKTTPPTQPPAPDPNGVPWDDAPASGTDLDVFGGAGAITEFNPAELKAGLRNLVTSIGEAGGIGGGVSFINVNQNDGSWQYGADRTTCEPAAEWALDTRTLKHGYSAWKEGKLLGETMVSIFQPRPPVTALRDVGAPYAAAFSVEMRCLGGEDKGTKCLYKNNSGGAVEAFEMLQRHLHARAELETPAVFPIVLLRNTSYHNTKYNKRIYKPAFHIVRWVDVRGNPDGGEPVKPAPQPAAATAAAAQPGVRRRRVEA